MATPPDTTSKALAVAACVFLALFLGVSAYFVSGAAINDADFSVSQALAHGEPGSMIALLASAIAALASLIVYRAHPYTHPRVLIAVVTGALLVVLMYPVADTGHYIIAGFVFLLLYASILLDDRLVRGRAHGVTTYVVGALAAALALAAVFTHITAVSQLFYTLELLSVALKLVSIMRLGFAHTPPALQAAGS